MPAAPRITVALSTLRRDFRKGQLGLTFLFATVTHFFHDEVSGKENLGAAVFLQGQRSEREALITGDTVASGAVFA